MASHGSQSSHKPTAGSKKADYAVFKEDDDATAPSPTAAAPAHSINAGHSRGHNTNGHSAGHHAAQGQPRTGSTPSSLNRADTNMSFRGSLPSSAYLPQASSRASSSATSPAQSGGAHAQSQLQSHSNAPSPRSGDSFAPANKPDPNAVDDAFITECRERFTQRWTYARYVVSGELFLFTLIYLSINGFDLASMGRDELTHWQMGTALFDVFFVVLARAAVFFWFLYSVTYEGSASRWAPISAYWVTLISLLLLICKLVVWDWSGANGGYTFLLLLTTLCCAAECAGAVMLAPHIPDKWGTGPEPELEARSKRLAANDEARLRAAAEARHLSGNALHDHEAREARRVEAAELVELQHAAAARARAEKEAWRYSELSTLLRPYFWPEGVMPRVKVALTWAALVASKVFSIIAPLFIGMAVDQLTSEETTPYGYLSLYCGFLFGSILLKQLQNAIYLQVKQHAFVELAQHTFSHLHSLSLQWHVSKKIGTVLRSSDRGILAADTVVTYLFLYLLPCIVECFVVFIIFLTVFREPLLSVIVLVHISAYLCSTFELTKWRKVIRRSTNMYDNLYHELAADSLINYETAKAFSNEEFEKGRYVDAIKQYQAYNVKTQYSLAFLNTLQGFIIQMCLLLALFVAGAKVASGELSIGRFSAVSAYVVQLFTPLSFLGTVFDMVIQSLTDMTSLLDLLGVKQDVKDAPDATELRLTDPANGATIEFRDVCFAYPEQRSGRGLDGVSFTVAPGTTTALVGTTGAGKSTIGKLLFRYYDTTGGHILIDGQDTSKVTQHSLRQALSSVPQDAVLYNETLLYNIRYGRLDATMEEVEQACRDAQILDFILSLKDKWETKVGERGLRLSGGEKQRVAIARALLKNPPIILLDEATSALDTLNEQRIQAALRSLEKGRTTLVIAHRLSTVMHAEQILVLEQGKIIERGTHDELLARDGKYAALWSQQIAAAEGSATDEPAAAAGAANGAVADPADVKLN